MCVHMYVCMYVCIYIYIYTSVLLCIYMHRVCGIIAEVDHIVMLRWWKACITQTFTNSITNPITNSTQKLSPTPITLSSCAIRWSYANAAGTVLLVCWLAALLPFVCP